MKKLILAFLSVFLIAACCLTVAAEGTNNDLPYDSYVYRWGETALAVPAPYVCEQTFTAADFGLSSFSSLSDIYVCKERIYLCDSGNNRIVILSKDWQFLTVVDTFMQGGVPDGFNAPTSVYERDGVLYVSDSLNSRIVELNAADFSFLKVLARPEISLLEENYTYTPKRVTVDAAGRVYVIAEGINRGLIELDADGTFSTFLGAPSVVPDLLEQLWRKISTKEQRSKMDKFVPTEYDSFYLDDYGFIYAVAKNTENEPFVKLNSQGTDVLAFEDDFGDGAYTDGSGLVLNPYFVDLCVDESNCYYLLDSQQGKIYVYTADGNQLYTFGANGSQQGTFYSASAIETVNETLCVIDASKNTINLFRRTDFGRKVIGAVKAQNNGEYESARELWKQVRHLCSHYPMAIIGIAQLDMLDGNYREALAELKAIDATKLYDKVYKQLRGNYIRENMGWLIAVGVALIVLLMVGFKAIKKIPAVEKMIQTPLFAEVLYGTYVMKHPFDGFWDLKHEKRGSLRGALITAGLFTICYGIRAQFSGYNVLGVSSSQVNALSKCLTVLIPLLLFVIANWCFTTLMDGEGTFKDIVIFTCYALKPYVWMSIPMFLFSQVVTSEEMVIYRLFDVVTLLWILLLLFVGMMMTHNFNLSKTVLTTVVTVIGICLLLFIALLLLNIAQDVIGFVKSIYNEITFRAY